MKLLIESLVFSHLSYSISVWGVSLKQHLVKRLERLQNRAVRLLFHLQKFDHVTCYYRRVSWLPFSDLIKYHSMCVMFHQFCGCGKGILLKPRPLFSLAGLLITITELKFAHTMRCRSSFTQSFFCCKATHWWNLLPSNIKSHVQFSDFKNDVKDFLSCVSCA